MKLGQLQEEKQLYKQISKATLPVTTNLMNSDANVTYQTVSLFSSDKCFIYFISDALHYIQ